MDVLQVQPSRSSFDTSPKISSSAFSEDDRAKHTHTHSGGTLISLIH